jgi:hypothetical protein
MNFLTTFLQKIESLFKKPAVQAAFNAVAEVIEVAEPIVADIALLTPNKTIAEVVTAYAKYAVPLAATISANPTSVGNALLNLATTVVTQNLKNPVAVNIVNTAVQIAVTAANAA